MVVLLFSIISFISLYFFSYRPRGWSCSVSLYTFMNIYIYMYARDDRRVGPDTSFLSTKHIIICVYALYTRFVYIYICYPCSTYVCIERQSRHHNTIPHGLGQPFEPDRPSNRQSRLSGNKKINKYKTRTAPAHTHTCPVVHRSELKSTLPCKICRAPANPKNVPTHNA